MSAPRASLPGHAGKNAGQRRSLWESRSTSWFRRTRLTGPSTRNTASSGNWNCRCNRCCSGCEHVWMISSRTALPKWRCVSSMRIACRRLRTSSSSTASSESRVTRNCEWPRRDRPGNRSCRCAVMIDVSSTNACLPPAIDSGTGITRGSTRGTLRMAIAEGRPKASLPSSSRMKFSDLFRICGNGCAGSRPIGDSRGRTSRIRYCRTQSRCAALRSGLRRMTTPRLARAGMTCSLYIAYWRRTS